MSSNIKLYQPEIEGLRAIAVLAVLFFHLNVPGFGGGFVGVDIFFVISGYLITKNIVSDLSARKFSFKSFYLRRIYRLFPALLVTLVTTLVASFFILTPEHFSQLGRSTLASFFSVSNILFWSEAGYFDEAKLFKPLLHTWSLGVEEQFYLLWPLLLFILYSKGEKFSGFIIILLGMISLIAAQALLSQYNALVFYWMPFRISEFAIGAILVLLCRRPNNSALSSFFATVGIGLILVPIVTYNEQTSFPGVVALIPCLGTALLIQFGKAPIIFPILSNSLSRQLGKISYSLYLVHWPVIVLVSYWKLGGLGLKSLVVVIPVIFLLAWALHHFVEQRFRLQKNETQSIQKSYGLIFLTVVVLVSSSHIFITKGWLWRYSGEAKIIVNAVSSLGEDSVDKQRLMAEYQSSFQTQESISRHYIIGDSFAADTMMALKFAMPNLNLKHLIIRAQCQPVLPGNYGESKAVEASCNRVRKLAYNNPGLKSATTIYLAASWREPAFSNVTEAIDFLIKNTSANIVVVGARASFHDVPTLAIKHGKESNLDKFVNKFKSQSVREKNETLRALAHQTNVEFIDVYQMMCPNDICTIISPLDKKIMYLDHAHLTLSGAKYLSNRLRKKTINE